MYKSYFGVKINDFRATGELLTCTGSSAGHRERWRTWRKPIRDLGEHVNQSMGHFGTITICAVSTPACSRATSSKTILKYKCFIFGDSVLVPPHREGADKTKQNPFALITLQCGCPNARWRPEPALFSSSFRLFSHTLPPTAALIAGMREGSICSLLSWRTERDALLFCCQSAFNNQK